MTGPYTHVQAVEKEILEIKAAGKTNREIAKEFGFKDKYVYENLLNRDFTARCPNQKWVTGMSYIHTAQGVLYLSSIRDLFDNGIVSYKTGTDPSVDFVPDIIRDARRKEKVAGKLRLHSDQGFSIGFSKLHNAALLRPCQGGATAMTMLWPRISFPFSKPNVSTGKSFPRLPSPVHRKAAGYGGWQSYLRD